MTQLYKIHRWDAVIFSDKGMYPIPTPIIYVKPDETLLKFAKDNSYALLVKIHAPGSVYDDKRVTGVWYKSSDIPNCRAVFFEKTELYVIVLQAMWHGYPDCLGDIEVFGLKGGVPAVEEEKEIDKRPFDLPLQKPVPMKTFRSVVGSGNIPAGGILGIVLAFLVLIGAVIFISKN